MLTTATSEMVSSPPQARRLTIAVVRVGPFALDQPGQVASELIERSLELARFAERLRQKHAAVPKEVVVSVVDTQQLAGNQRRQRQGQFGKEVRRGAVLDHPVYA